MSETTTATQDGGAAAPEPAATAAETTAPVENGAATEQEEARRPSREERRIAVLSAKLAALGAENETLRAAAPPRREPDPTPPRPEDVPRLIEERVAAEVAARDTQRRVEAFHTAGKAEYKDWGERCSSLIQMGADANFAALLLEMPEGVKLAAALADEPEELERIAGLKTERARAIALGRFAATFEARPAAERRPPPVTKLAEPIRPVTGHTSTAPDPYRMTSAQLVEHYSHEAMRKRGLA